MIIRSVRRLLPYVWPHRRGLFIVLVSLVLSVGLDVLRPWPMKVLVDNVLGGHAPGGIIAAIIHHLPGAETPRGLLVWVAAATVLTFLAFSALQMASTMAFVGLGQRMVYGLGEDVYAHLQRMSLRYHSRREVGDLVARVTVDTYCVQSLVSSTLFPLLHSGLTLVAVFGIMWHLDHWMALLSLAVVPLLALLIGGFSKAMEEAARLRSDLDAKLMSLTEQTLGAIPAVQAFARERLEQARFRRTAEEAVAAHRSSTGVDMKFKLLVGLVTSLGTAGLLWLGASRALDGRMTIGTILVFLAYLASLYEPINDIVYTAATLQTLSANTARVLEVLDEAPDVAERTDALDVPLTGHVRYEDVRFAYEPDRPVLKGVSLEARPGEVVAVVGPSGAGKSTLLSLLPRLLDPSGGRVLVDGHDVRELKLESLRRQVALVLQEPFLFPISIAENIAFGRPDAARAQIEAAAVAANAHEFIQGLSEGYDTIIGERGSTLSGGERQRLSIARAFLKNAPILILDEPTSALDAITEGMLVDAIERLSEGRTTFIIAHRLTTIRKADRILVLDGGQIVESGTHEQLIGAGGVYANLQTQGSALAEALSDGASASDWRAER
jgi:ATP-binding cassette subfamily B protein/subfamily B ATP-binding cassette protein MsbA